MQYGMPERRPPPEDGAPCGQRQSDVAGALRKPEFLDPREATAMLDDRYFSLEYSFLLNIIPDLVNLSQSTT
jgi:hypothetical protein